MKGRPEGRSACEKNYHRGEFALEITGLDLAGLLKQEARSFLTGLLIGGIELKDRSVGGWRSGLQRSEK